MDAEGDEGRASARHFAPVETRHPSRGVHACAELHTDPGRGRSASVEVRESPEENLQYLHVLDAWPESGELDDFDGVESGEFVNGYAMGDTVHVHQPDGNGR